MLVVDADLPNAEKVYGAYLDAVPRTTKKILRKAMQAWRNDLAAEMQRNLSGGMLNKRTGALLRAARANNIVVREVDDGFEVRLRHVPTYGKAHEYGAQIKPSGQYLAIPIGPAASAQRKRTPRQYKKTFLRPGSGGVDWIVYWRQSRDQVVPIFLYVKQVELPPKPWFATSVRDAWPKLIERVQRGISDAGAK